MPTWGQGEPHRRCDASVAGFGDLSTSADVSCDELHVDGLRAENPQTASEALGIQPSRPAPSTRNRVLPLLDGGAHAARTPFGTSRVTVSASVNDAGLGLIPVAAWTPVGR